MKLSNVAIIAKGALKKDCVHLDTIKKSFMMLAARIRK